MVKIIRRLKKRTCKGSKEAIDTQYRYEFSRKLNSKIEPHWQKKFDQADVTFQETEEKEVFNLSLTRYKRKPKSAPAH
jgi:hypothetical protein